MALSTLSNKPSYQVTSQQSAQRAARREVQATQPVIPSVKAQDAGSSRGGPEVRDSFGAGQAQGAQWPQFASGVSSLVKTLQQLEHTLTDLSHGLEGSKAPSSSSMPQDTAAAQGAGTSGPGMDAGGQEQVPDLGGDEPQQTQPAQASSSPSSSSESSPSTSSPAAGGSKVNSLLAPDQATADAEIKRQYNDWKSRYVTDQGTGGPGQLRVVRPEDNHDTVSEGIGYGMMLAAQNGDQKTLDGLWKYAQGHLNQNGVMDWKIDSNNKVIGQNGATDADEDMAMALVVADKKFGGYKQDATQLINNIKQHEVEPGSHVLKPGDAWGGSDKTNPSYFAPAYYKAFGEFTGDKSWDQVADKSYDILDKIAQQPGYKDSGLVPDWVNAEGQPSPGGEKYSYDASRTPWRIGTDAAWYGDKRATAFLDKLNSFWGKQGLGNISDGYDASGHATGGNHNATFTSTAAAGAITSSDAGFRSQAWKEALAAPGGNYFNDSLRALSVLQIGGRMEKP